MNQTTYSITDLAREFDITPRTIRFYEEKGMLTPARQGHRRVFSKADRVRLKLILRGKRIGMSLEECIDIIDMYQHGQNNAAQLQVLLDKIERKQAQLNKQISDILALKKDLELVHETVSDALRAVPGNPPVKRPAQTAGER